MSSRSTEMQVGAALVLALLSLVFGLMWFQDYQVGSSYARVEVVFPKVGGLGAGDPVSVRGISMGKVSEVELVDQGVLVVLRMKSDVQLREDTEFRLGSAGIMGERMVSVEPGQGAPVGSDQRIFEGVYEAASTELVGQFEEFNIQVMAFLDRADAVLASLQDDEVLVKTLENTARAAELAGDLLEENRGELGRAATSMADLAKRFDEFLTEHEADMGRGIEGLARATGSLDSLTTKLNTVLDGTDDVLTALREQKGAAGKMIYDEAAGENLVESLKQLRFLVEDLQRNPERYLTVKIF